MDAAGKSLLDNTEFILELCRFSENLTTEAAVRKRFRLPDDVWEGLGKDEELVAAIEAEKVRRIRNGATARERAQQLFASVPDTLGKILNAADDVSPRHKIESARELRAIAANTGPEAAPATDEKFTITIVLNADEKIRVSKATGIIPHDVETIEHDADTTPQLLPAIAAKKNNDDGSRGGAW
jgi:hypothetical protein